MYKNLRRMNHLIIGILFAVVMTLLFGGCPFFQPSQTCNEAPPDSLICRYIPNPGSADLLIQLGMYEFLKANPKAKDQVADFIEIGLEKLDVDSEILWTEIIAYIVSKSRYLQVNYGGEIVIVSGHTTALNRPVPIIPYDKGLLKIHLKKLLNVVMMIPDPE